MVLSMSRDEVFYQAMLARDERFDGKFFVGVKTTGIYCRPICPAKPKRENVEFFKDAPAAEKAGYRPCLRCRPESAPESPAWVGRSVLVRRALRLIAIHGHAGRSEEDFAAQLGVSARHLRRLFMEEVGRTPKQIADNNRLNFARQLLVETALPVTTVAMTAGFSSLRRFNDAFQKRFHRAPSVLRKKQKTGTADSLIELSLSYRPPYDWQHLLDFYGSHLLDGLERVEGNSFERVFELEGQPGFLRVSPVAGKAVLKLEVHLEDPRLLLGVVNRVRRMFDLDSDPLLVANAFRVNPLLSRLHKKNPGLRLPRGWDPFETAVRAILGQLVSVKQGNRFAAQLMEAYGREIRHPLTGETRRLFPTAEVLEKSDLAALKTTGARKDAIRELCRRVREGTLSLAEAQDADEFRRHLRAIKGLGPWTSEYIALRAFGDPDAFPGTDLILKRVLDLHPELDLERIRPWRSYGAIYLWKEFAQSLSKKKEKTP